MKKQIFVDSGFGQKGYWAWLILLCFIGLMYKLFMLANTYLISYKNFPEVIVGFIFICNLFLLVTAVVFVAQGLKTAQRIELVEDSLDIVLYFGKHMRINVHDIKKVEQQTQHAYIRNFITPLGRGGKIYKICMEDGFFYINEAMENAFVFIEEVKKMRVRGSSSLNAAH